MNVERIKREIYRLIDESRNNLVKASFYGDPEVAAVLDRLYARWNKSGRVGEPLDYANKDELYFLLSKAREHSTNPRVQYMHEVMSGRRSREKKGRKRGSAILEFLRKLRLI